jgi:hypothetical protein
LRFCFLNIEENKGKLGLEDKSNNELSALDEQRVMKTRVKRSINGSGKVNNI